MLIWAREWEEISSSTFRYQTWAEMNLQRGFVTSARHKTRHKTTMPCPPLPWNIPEAEQGFSSGPQVAAGAAGAALWQIQRCGCCTFSGAGPPAADCGFPLQPTRWGHQTLRHGGRVGEDPGCPAGKNLSWALFHTLEPSSAVLGFIFRFFWEVATFTTDCKTPKSLNISRKKK